MSTPTREPSFPLARLHDEFERILQDVGMPGFLTRAGRSHHVPSVDVYEKDGSILMEAELPGVAREDIKVSCTDHSVVIYGETRKDAEEKKDGYYRSERRVGRFYRTVPVPEEVDFEKATAEFNNGVLKITLPRVAPEKERTRTIPVSG